MEIEALSAELTWRTPPAEAEQDIAHYLCEMRATCVKPSGEWKVAECSALVSACELDDAYNPDVIRDDIVAELRREIGYHAQSAGFTVLADSIKIRWAGFLGKKYVEIVKWGN